MLSTFCQTLGVFLSLSLSCPSNNFNNSILFFYQSFISSHLFFTSNILRSERGCNLCPPSWAFESLRLYISHWLHRTHHILISFSSPYLFLQLFFTFFISSLCHTSLTLPHCIISLLSVSDENSIINGIGKSERLRLLLPLYLLDPSSFRSYTLSLSL